MSGRTRSAVGLNFAAIEKGSGTVWKIPRAMTPAQIASGSFGTAAAASSSRPIRRIEQQAARRARMARTGPA